MHAAGFVATSLFTYEYIFLVSLTARAWKHVKFTSWLGVRIFCMNFSFDDRKLILFEHY